MSCETLERRRLLSVSVIQGFPGYYEIRGDEGPNAISIAISDTDGSFSLDGVTFGGVSHVSVFGYAGDDSISVAADRASPISISVNAGPGADNVAVTGNGSIWGDSGNDTLRLTDSFRGQLFGGPGDDRLTVTGDCANPEIDGESGSDYIDASSNNGPVFARGGSGNDTVFGSNFDDLIYGDEGNDLLIGAGGHDMFYGGDGAYDRIIGGGGIDTAQVDQNDGVWGVEYVFYI